MRYRYFIPLVFILLVACTNCHSVSRSLVDRLTPEYEVENGERALAPVFEEGDLEREQLAVALTRIAEDLPQPTDIQFAPGDSRHMVVLGKEGVATWVDLETGDRGEWFSLPVVTKSEEGLLGLAFHPQFAANGRFYVNGTFASGRRAESRIIELAADPEDFRRPVEERRVILTVEQPYPNHNAGGLAFGPDGYLYIGWGDGGLANDPHRHGQDPSTMLGTLIRIDVDRADDGREYAIPANNPFVDKDGFLPEIWAWGLRNPWRLSFDHEGRLFVADVGQALWEEVNLVERGDNLGWRYREATHCFRPSSDCPSEGLVDPVVEYTRNDGGSITGGYVYTGGEIEALQGLYVFGDFLSGRLWAFDPSGDRRPGELRPLLALGKWPMLPSTLGRDGRGRIYVGDFGAGTVYRIEKSGAE